MSDFPHKLAQLKSDLVTQGERVMDLLHRAIRSYFELDEALAEEVIRADETIDRVDVEIERASIPLLTLGETAEHSIRSVLTIVKINNELERIADCAVNIAEVVVDYGELAEQRPRTFQVMANSVIGILRDANTAVAHHDTDLAKRVLNCDDTIDRFKREIVLNAQQRIATGEYSVAFGFRLLAVTKALERIADHCTNICEQVIYLQTGKIVRHLPHGWSEPAAPELGNG